MRLKAICVSKSALWALATLTSVGAFSAPTHLVDPVTLDGHVYALTDTGSSWTEAETFAQSLGGHLATIDSAAQNAFLYQAYVVDGGNQDLWIGLNCAACSNVLDPAAWRWADGSTPVYLNFRPGQPDVGTGNDRYAVMNFAGTDQWDNYPDSGFRTPRAIVELAVPEPGSLLLYTTAAAALFGILRFRRTASR